MAGEARVGIRDVLAQRATMVLWGVDAQSTVGDQLARVAVTILVYDQTRSAAWSALVLAMTYLPDLVGTLWLTWLADRYLRPLVMSGCAAFQALVYTMIAVFGGPPWWIVLAIALSTVVMAPYRAAGQALLYDVVESSGERLALQNLLTFTRTLGQICGLGIGGVVAAGMGPQWALLINAMTFVIAAVALFNRRLRTAGSAAVAGSSASTMRVLEHGRAARAELRSSRLLVSITGLMCLAGITAIPDAIAVPMASQLHLPHSVIGVMLAAHPVGLGLYTLAIRPSPPVASLITPLLVLLSLAPLVCFVALLAWPSLWLPVVLLVVSGVGLGYHPALQHEFAEATPDHVRAGVISYARLALRLAQGVGTLLGGLLTDWTGSPAAVVAGTAACGLVAAYWGLRARTRALGNS